MGLAINLITEDDLPKIRHFSQELNVNIQPFPEYVDPKLYVSPGIPIVDTSSGQNIQAGRPQLPPTQAAMIQATTASHDMPSHLSPPAAAAAARPVPSSNGSYPVSTPQSIAHTQQQVLANVRNIANDSRPPPPRPPIQSANQPTSYTNSSSPAAPSTVLFGSGGPQGFPTTQETSSQNVHAGLIQAMTGLSVQPSGQVAGRGSSGPANRATRGAPRGHRGGRGARGGARGRGQGPTQGPTQGQNQRSATSSVAA